LFVWSLFKKLVKVWLENSKTMSFELLNAEVEKGLGDFNRGIPMGFDRLTRYVGIRKGMYYLIGGNTGSGKTSFIDDAFVLNPVDWALSKEGIASGIKVKVWYRSMERSRTYKMAKWVSRKIFLDQGIIIPVGKLLGWNEKMTKDEHDLFLYYKDYVDQLSEIVTIIDGPENPVGIAKELKAYALDNGSIEQMDQWNKIYVPNDPTQITMVVVDHIGLLKTTTAQPTKKDAIDKMSDELRYARDFYGYSPVVVSQFNRSISNPSRIKNGDVEPQLEDFADSSSTQNDADVVMALFDPMRYKVADPSGYDLDKLKDQYGAKYFRSLRLIKNSYGEDDVRIGLGFFGQIGMFKELNRKKDMTDADYESVVNKSWFLR
jgi:KaiC/GvpD/RAD55 family RecA-like ATPase